jgi:hypothetical protein
MAIKKTTILCADVKMYTQETLMKVGETRKGALTMHDEFSLQFNEQLPQTCERNPKIWAGRHFNVHKNRKGEYVVNFKRLALNALLDPYNFAEQVFVDVERAKVELGL